MDSSSLDGVAETLRAFVARAQALRAVALLDRGPDAEPAIVDCDGRGAVEVEERGETRELDPAPDTSPLAVPHVHPLPPMDVDPEAGQVTGTVGGLQHLAEAVGELAEALGGRSVVTAQFQSTDPDVPLAVSARRGEPPVIALGGRTFTL
jgi:hypothetical protein